MTVRFAALLWSAFLLAGCGLFRHDVRAPAASPTARVPQPPQEALINVPVRVSLAKLQELARAELPKNVVDEAEQDIGKLPVYYSVTIPTKIAVQVPRQVLRTVVKLVPRKVTVGHGLACLAFPPACFTVAMVKVTERVWETVFDTVEHVVDEVTTVMNPFDVLLSYKADVVSMSIVRGRDEALQVSAVVDFQAKATVAGAGLAKVDGLSCGYDEEKPRLSVTTTGTLQWANGGRKLEFAKREPTLQWKRRCNLTALKISLEEVLNLPLVKQKVTDLVNEKFEELNTTVDLGSKLDDGWRKVSVPLQIADDVWLDLQPERLSLGSFAIDGDGLRTVVALQALPMVRYGARPATKPPRPATIDVKAPATNTFRVTPEAQISLDEAEKLLTAKLGGRDFKVGPTTVRFEKARIYGSGNEAVIAVWFQKPFRGTLYLRGEPRYDEQKRAVRFEELGFTVESEQVLVKLIDVALHRLIVQWISERAELGVNKYLTKALDQLGSFSIPLGDDARLVGGVDGIIPVDVFMTRDALVAWAKVTGNACLQIGAGKCQ